MQMQMQMQMHVPQMRMMPGGTFAYNPMAAGKTAAPAKTEPINDVDSRNDSRKSKYRKFKNIPEQTWRSSVEDACKEAFTRLQILTGNERRNNVMQRISEGKSNDTAAAAANGTLPCYLVKRENMESTSPFQLQVSGARILVHKAFYAAYQGLTIGQMGTWQVAQKCLHRDSTWWCLEPTHLERCFRDHVALTVTQHPIPFPPDAIYLARYRKSRSKKGKVNSGSGAALVSTLTPPASQLPAGRSSENAGQDGLSQIAYALQLPIDESDPPSTPESNASDDRQRSVYSANLMCTVQPEPSANQWRLPLDDVPASSASGSSSLLPPAPHLDLSQLATLIAGQSNSSNASPEDSPGSYAALSTPPPPQEPSMAHLHMEISANPQHEPSFDLAGGPLHLENLPANADESLVDFL